MNRFGFKRSLFAASAILLGSTSIFADSYRPHTAYAEVRAISNAVVQFQKDHGRLPTQIEDLVSMEYLDRFPSDPWGREYFFSSNPPYASSEDLDFYVWSFGADGHAGGEGVAADIGNWQSDWPRRKPWWQFW